MNKSITNAALALTIAATLAFNAANAATDGVSSEKSVTNGYLTYVVRFSDLDVTKIEGAKTLYARLRIAAKVVCEPLESASSWGARQYQACMGKAIADAVTSVNRPLLTQYHQSRTGNDKSGPIQVAKAN